MIKAIAVDDEPLSLKIIEKFCGKSDIVSLKETFTQTTEASTYLERNEVDLLFLDINMPAISGIDFYKSLSSSPMLIFTTAYPEFALEGFNLSAVDYLVKPFTYERFEKAVLKARDYQQHNKPKDLPLERYILIKAEYSLIKIFLKDILYIEVMDNYLKINLDDGKQVITRMPMKAILDKLPAEDFIRVHRSYVVPFTKIKSIRNKIIHIGNKEIPIGNSYESAFFNQFRDGL